MAGSSGANFINPLKSGLIAAPVGFYNDIKSGKSLKQIATDSMGNSTFHAFDKPSLPSSDAPKAENPDDNAARAQVAQGQGQAATLLTGTNGTSSGSSGTARTLLGY